jgi:hypothetical protein
LRPTVAFGLAVHLAFSACAPPLEEDPTDDTTLAPPASVAGARLRRLSRDELDATLADLFGVTDAPATRLLPPDPLTPFDNALAYAEPSALWFEGIERVADEVATAVSADEARARTLMGCAPSARGSEAEACLTAALPNLMRRVLRREVRGSDVNAAQTLLDAAWLNGDDAASALRMLIRGLLLDPWFAYRVEQVDPASPGRVDGATLASRLSYFVWGSAPDKALLDAARDGSLRTAEGRAAQAARMLTDPRARAQAQRLHAQWLGYSVLVQDAQIAAMQRMEADLFLGRVLFDDGSPWRDVLTDTRFPVMSVSANVYGVPNVPEGDWRWIDVEHLGRAGILSMTAFLTASSHPADTSPTRRGKMILDRVLCKPPPPPPPTVSADTPPSVDLARCKLDRYAQHRTDPTCAACHASMDAIGAGLERYDRGGVYRTHDYLPYQRDPDLACPLPEGGEVPGVGSFTTVGDLGRLLAATGEPTACFTEHLVRQAYADADGLPVSVVVGRVLPRALDAGERYHDLIRAIVEDSAFEEPLP